MFPNIIPIRCRNFSDYGRLIRLVERLNELTTECPLVFALASRSASPEVDGVMWVDVWSDSPGKLQHFCEEWQVWSELLPMTVHGLELLYNLPPDFKPTEMQTSYHLVDIDRVIQDAANLPERGNMIQVDGLEIVKDRIRKKRKAGLLSWLSNLFKR